MELVKVLSEEEVNVIQRSNDKDVVGDIIGFKDFTNIETQQLEFIIQFKMVYIEQNLDQVMYIM